MSLSQPRGGDVHGRMSLNPCDPVCVVKGTLALLLRPLHRYQRLTGVGETRSVPWTKLDTLRHIGVGLNVGRFCYLARQAFLAHCHIARCPLNTIEIEVCFGTMLTERSTRKSGMQAQPWAEKRRTRHSDHGDTRYRWPSWIELRHL